MNEQASRKELPLDAKEFSARRSQLFESLIVLSTFMFPLCYLAALSPLMSMIRPTDALAVVVYVGFGVSAAGIQMVGSSATLMAFPSWLPKFLPPIPGWFRLLMSLVFVEGFIVLLGAIAMIVESMAGRSEFAPDDIFRLALVAPAATVSCELVFWLLCGMGFRIERERDSSRQRNRGFRIVDILIATAAVAAACASVNVFCHIAEQPQPEVFAVVGVIGVASLVALIPLGLLLARWPAWNGVLAFAAATVLFVVVACVVISRFQMLTVKEIASFAVIAGGYFSAFALWGFAHHQFGYRLRRRRNETARVGIDVADDDDFAAQASALSSSFDQRNSDESENGSHHPLDG